MSNRAVHVLDLVSHDAPTDVPADEVWLIQAPTDSDLPPVHQVLEGAYDRELSRQWYEMLAAPQVRNDERSRVSVRDAWALHRSMAFWPPVNRHAVELARELERARPDSLTITTDHQAGRDLARLTARFAPVLGIDHVEIRHLVTNPTVAGRIPARAADLRARFRHLAHLLQDLTYVHRNVAPNRSTDDALVVLYCDSPRNWELLAPVHEALKAQHAAVSVLTTRPPMAKRLRSAGVNVVMARSRPQPLLWRKVRRHVRESASATNVMTSEKLRESLIEIALEQYRAALPRVAASRRAVFRLSRHCRRVCVAHASEGQPAAWSAVIAAIDTGLGTALLPHGIADPASPIYAYYPPIDTFLVWGEQSAQELAESGLGKHIAVEVVGAPNIEKSIAAAREHPAPPAKDGLILVVFGRPSRVLAPLTYSAAVDQVLDAAAQLPEFRFVVKPHPADTTGYWDNVVARNRLPNLEVRNDTFYTLLPQSWVVVTMHSTAGAEAICAGRPVIRVSPEDHGSGDDQHEHKSWEPFPTSAVYTARRSGDLGRVICHLQDIAPHDELRQGREEFSRRFLHMAERPAARLTADTLVGLADLRCARNCR